MLGTPRVHHRRTDSTSSRARELALAGAPHGTLVTAAEQSAGRGRQGRTWSAPAGRALLLSLVLREPPTLLPLAAALAVADVCGPGARIKWPNDVWLDGRKAAGILVEGRPSEGWAILGIGLNVAMREEDFPAELRATATGLGREPADLEPVLGELLAALGRRLGEGGAATLAAWRERDALLGRDIRWNGGSGVAAGVDAAGQLVVELPGGGTASLAAGEVHLGSSATT